MPRLVIVEAKKPISAHTAYSIVTPLTCALSANDAAVPVALAAVSTRQFMRLIHSGATSVPARYPAKQTSPSTPRPGGRARTRSARLPSITGNALKGRPPIVEAMLADSVKATNARSLRPGGMSSHVEDDLVVQHRGRSLPTTWIAISSVSCTPDLAASTAFTRQRP